jgi:membrane-associated phospholipid phosphatase
MTLRKPWLVGLLVVAGVTYLAMWFGWAYGWSPLVRFDSSSLAALLRFDEGHPAWVTFWDVLCTVFSPAGFKLIVLVPVGLALVRREWRIALFLFVCVELAGLVTFFAKSAANRPRPDTALVSAPSSSFPSGHALAAMASVLAIGVVVLPMIRRTRWVWVIAAGAVLVVAVGFGRVVLNVHNPSDVVAGWALGYVYFAACLLLLVRRRVTEADETPAVRDTVT